MARYGLSDIAMNQIGHEEISTIHQLRWTLSQDDLPPYLICEVEGNNIGSAGCNYLSQASIDEL